MIPNVTISDVGRYYCVVWAENKASRSNRAKLLLSGTYVRLITYTCHIRSYHVQYMYIYYISNLISMTPTLAKDGGACDCQIPNLMLLGGWQTGQLGI